MLRRIPLLALLSLALASCGDPPPRRRNSEDDDWAREAREGNGSTGQGLNVRVDVDCYEVDERDESGWSAFWAASIPIGNARLSINGLRAATGGPKFFASLSAWERSSTVRREERPFIVTADGYPGSIEVSEIRAEPVTLVFLDNGQIIDTYRWTRAGATLEVTPQRLGDGTIRVTVHPTVAHREGNGVTSFKQLDTTVVLRDGEAVVLGGTSSSQDTVGSTFFSRVRGGRRYRLVFVVRAKSW